MKEPNVDVIGDELMDLGDVTVETKGNPLGNSGDGGSGFVYTG